MGDVVLAGITSTVCSIFTLNKAMQRRRLNARGEDPQALRHIIDALHVPINTYNTFYHKVFLMFQIFNHVFKRVNPDP